MTTSETAARRIIDLSIEGRHGDAEAEMERVVSFDEGLIRKVVREEIDRTRNENERRIERITKLMSAILALAGAAFPAAIAFFAYATFDVEPPLVGTLAASAILAAVGVVVGRKAAK